MEKYENLGLVGEGSYGIVMKCRHKSTGTLVAIKKFLESEDDKIVKRIANREIKMLKQLRHENLVNLIDLFKRKKKLYLVFEFVDYTLLDDLEKNPTGLEYNYAKRILFQVLRGIEFCHNKDVIHRDIKPENILVTKTGIVKLCDFGFARPLSGQSNSFTDYVATRWYRAPELLVGDTKYGKPVDIWAIGCLTSEMFAGDPLFPGDSDIDQLFHIIKCIGYICPKHVEIFRRNALFKGLQMPESNSKYSLENRYPKIDKDVINFIKKCLDPSPELRPNCGQLLASDLFPEKFADLLVNEIRIKVQKEREKNPLLKSSLNSQSPNLQKHENINMENSSNKGLFSKPVKVNSTAPKIISNYNFKSKIFENNQIANNSNNNNTVIFKNDFTLNNQENEITSDKNFVYVDEDAWEDVRPLTSRKERVASRAGRYNPISDELFNKEDNLNDSLEHIAPDIHSKTDADDVQKRTTNILYKDVTLKHTVNMTNTTTSSVQNKINISPRNTDTPLQDNFNKSKPTQAAFIQIKTTENTKFNEKSSSIDSNFNRSSPTCFDLNQAHSLHFPMNSKKPIPTFTSNSINGNSTLTSKSQINSFNTLHQQLNSNTPFSTYPVKANANNFQQRNFGFPADTIVHSYLPNIGKDQKFRQPNTHFHSMSPSNKTFIPSNNTNVFKSSSPLANDKVGYYYNSPNKRRPLVTTRPNLSNCQENISLPELKGAEMPIIRNQIHNSNIKYKYITPKATLLPNDSPSNTNHMDNFTNREP